MVTSILPVSLILTPLLSQSTETAYQYGFISKLSNNNHHLDYLQTMKTMLSKLRFGKSDRGDGLPHRNSPRYSMPKVFRASTLRARSPNDQAARLAKKGEEAHVERDIDPSEKGGQVKRPRDFSFVGHADEDIVRKQNTTFEGLAKRGVIPKSALEPLMKVDK